MFISGTTSNNMHALHQAMMDPNVDNLDIATKVMERSSTIIAIRIVDTIFDFEGKSKKREIIANIIVEYTADTYPNSNSKLLMLKRIYNRSNPTAHFFPNGVTIFAKKSLLRFTYSEQICMGIEDVLTQEKNLVSNGFKSSFPLLSRKLGLQKQDIKHGFSPIPLLLHYCYRIESERYGSVKAIEVLFKNYLDGPVTNAEIISKCMAYFIKNISEKEIMSASRSQNIATNEIIKKLEVLIKNFMRETALRKGFSLESREKNHQYRSYCPTKNTMRVLNYFLKKNVELFGERNGILLFLADHYTQHEREAAFIFMVGKIDSVEEQDIWDHYKGCNLSLYLQQLQDNIVRLVQDKRGMIPEKWQAAEIVLKRKMKSLKNKEVSI